MRRLTNFRLAGSLGIALLLFATTAAAERSFVAFESAPVRPLVLSPDGTRLFACNTPDNTLEIFDVGPAGLTRAGSVKVGLEPVAVAARTNGEVWVVNHLSDSISIVDVAGGTPRVTRTLLVGDEPNDIVFAGSDGDRAFVTTAHRGQASPYPRGDYDVSGAGRADVWVFDATSLGVSLGGDPITIVTLFGDKPRALATSPDGSTVYAAVFRSGNRTTTIHEALVCDSSAAAVASETAEGPCTIAGTLVPGGYPPPLRNREGTPFDETGLIVKLDRDGVSPGQWTDELGRDWSAAVRLDLPDLDVFAIAADASPPVETAAYANVGTLLFNMVVNPLSGKLYVSGTEALNHLRLEGPGTLAAAIKPAGEPASLRGHLTESRITVIEQSGAVTPRHLNKHIDYDAISQPLDTKEKSLATPLGMAVSDDGSILYVAAFGSNKIGVFPTADLEADTFVPDAGSHIVLSGGGPASVVLDGDRLYTLTRFDNSVVVVDLTAGAVGAEAQSIPLYNPEPAHVREGRPLLYDARLTSSNGEASCASCHPFADMDDLAWDLGNPDDDVVDNTNGMSTGTLTPFHPIKGPMATQSLRGLASMGPQHWRGDRQGDAVAAFNAFNVAFASLLGRDEGEIPAADMQKFTDFVLEIAYPPNPIRLLDNSLRLEEASGAALFDGGSSDTTGACIICHSIQPSLGFFGSNALSADQFSLREFKTPHLRNVYQKVGMFGMPRTPRLPSSRDYSHQGPQVRGFGFLHDGSVDTLFRFVDFNVFFVNEDSAQRDLEAFMLAFPSDLPPMVGQQITRTPTSSAAVDARIDAMIAAASAPYPTKILGSSAMQCDVVVHGAVASEQIGGVFLAGSDVLLDDGSQTPESALRSLSDTPGQELTYTCVPFGSGARIGVDRDEDGALNRVDNCPEVFNPQQTDANTDGVGDVCEPGATTTTTTTTTTTSTTTTTLVAARTFETRMLKITRLARPAGEQKLKLASRDLEAAGAAIDPAGEALAIAIANGPKQVFVATIAAGDADWRANGSATRFKWRSRSAPHPAGLRSFAITVRDDVLRMRAKSAGSDAVAAVGAAQLSVTLTIGDDEWAGPTPSCAAGNGSLTCR